MVNSAISDNVSVTGERRHIGRKTIDELTPVNVGPRVVSGVDNRVSGFKVSSRSSFLSILFSSRTSFLTLGRSTVSVLQGTDVTNRDSISFYFDSFSSYPISSVIGGSIKGLQLSSTISFRSPFPFAVLTIDGSLIPTDQEKTDRRKVPLTPGCLSIVFDANSDDLSVYLSRYSIVYRSFLTGVCSSVSKVGSDYHRKSTRF